VVAFIPVSIIQDVASSITSITSVTPTAILASAAAIATAMMSLLSFCWSHFGEHNHFSEPVSLYT
jgi:cytosine/uracil/thiamine/allantoin permease